MTYTAAATIDNSWAHDRRASSAIAGRALRVVRNSFLLGIGAAGFVGVSAMAVTFTAAWMAGGTLQPHVRLPSGPGSLALVAQNPAANVAASGQGSSQWAGAFIDRTKPLLPAERSRTAAAPVKASAPSIARAPAVPLPRPMPSRLAQSRAEVEQPVVQAAPQAVAKVETKLDPRLQSSPTAKLESLMAPELPSVIIPVARNADIKIPDARPQIATTAKVEAMVKLEPKAAEPPKPAAVASIPPATLPADVSRTAVYDITGAIVHMPDGTKLEAHSGLGERRDDPRHIKVRMRGPTPPNVYVLTEREKLFHGVRAVRLNPVYDDKMFGRDGMLAHTYMLGPNGQSNGCVSFKDYKKFLTAFLEGKVDKMVVVGDLKGQSWKTAAMQADGISASPRRFAGGYSRPTISPRGGDDAPSFTASIGTALGFAPERGAGTW